MKVLSSNFLITFFNAIAKRTSLEKLRGNTWLLISANLVTLLSFVYLIASSLLLSNIKLAEERNVHQSVNEVLQEHNKIADDLSYVNIGWSEWDTTYHFIQNYQEADSTEDLKQELFPNRRFDLAVIFNKSGRNIFAKEWDNTSQKTLPIPSVLAKQIYPENILVQYPNTGKSVSGIVTLPEGTMLISSLPLLNNQGEGAIRGGLILGRYIQTAEIVKRISDSESLTESVDVHSINEKQMPPDFEEARLALSDKNSIVVRNLNDQKVAGYTWLKDIYGKPALLVRVEKDRELYLQGKKNLSYLMIFLTVIGIIFSSAAQLLLQQLITFKVKRKESEARYRIVVSQASESIFLVDAETKHFLEVNTAFEKLLGYTLKEILGLTLNDILVENSEGHKQYLHYISAKAEHFTCEKQYRSRNGYFVDVEVNVNLISYAGKQVFCHVVRDITNRKQAEAALRESEQRLAWQANHDSLTGLVNRRKFEQHLEQALNSAKVSNVQHSLCYLDLDKFKIINDTCGHIAGDELLRQVTALLQSQIRTVDIVARLGGDEFGLILNQCTSDHALIVANALIASIRAFQFVWEDKIFKIGVSIGVVAVNGDSPSLINTLSAADSACYTAKNQGRDRVYISQLSDCNIAQHNDMQWIKQINKAIEEDRFCLYYQSITPTNPQTLRSWEYYEVLLRLRDESDKIIPPMEFIPAAERYNLMQLIDRWVIKTLFATQGQYYRETYAQYQNVGGFCLYAINLSGASINDEYFIDFLHQQIKIHQIPPQVLCFEITEIVAIANLAKVVAFIDEFKQLGCSFALDDFGTGMSSFDRLKKLPVDYLKINGGLIKDILTDPKNLAMTEAINQVSHAMGFKTIATFVENAPIFKKICELGVDYAQGYDIAIPCPLVIPQLHRQGLILSSVSDKSSNLKYMTNN
ncbi:bifunctional diguanylate cyclase/phosphodiesterase [Chlorogloea sp. CCALA 695]|nr:bifunctional diguanylate cyclase/phosphodiesterase [Chlorogloea sp. CCALA 695]